MAERFGDRFSTIKVATELKSTETIDVQGFPVMLNWYLVHRRNKRLPPVATAFEEFLLKDGASLIESITHFSAHRGTRPGSAQRTETPRAKRQSKT